MPNIVDEEFLSDDDILNIVLDAEKQMEEALEDSIRRRINPLIIKGPPGTGKSKAIEIATKQAGVKSIDFLASTWTKPSEDEIKQTGSAYPYHCDHLKEIDGALIRGSDYSKWALAADLYANRNGGVICLDDNDAILMDVDAASLIMKATEQTATRTVGYAKANSTHELLMYGVEPSFEVNTSIIILTNMDMRAMVEYEKREAEKKKKPLKGYINRWAAMLSRSSEVDLQMNSPRSIRVYCEHKIRQVGMLTNSPWLEKEYGRCLTEEESEKCLRWVRLNQGRLSGPLDLRTYNKLAGILISRPDTWEESAGRRLFN